MRSFHKAVLDCHAQFGGELEDMQRRYDAASDLPLHSVQAFSSTLATRISIARTDAGKTQQQIADAIGCHVNQYQRLETARHRISAFDLARVAEAIGVPVENLVAPAPVPRAGT